ncbi:MAG: tRNA methyl transferase PRC-barrel domain-containing protein, partial [Patescibacteria group bacterium]
IGEHDGAQLYTIGQRHGFRLSAKMSNIAKPHYVVSKDIKKNILVVAEGNENHALFRKKVKLVGVNLMLPVKNGMSVLARVRYRQPLSTAKLMILGIKTRPKYELVFKKPQKFVAEGQSAVFYKTDGGLAGGGIIV